MSDLSDKKPAVTESATKVADLGASTQAPSKAVQIWAVIGGAILILQLYVWTRWITGPYFERVPGGPSDPPLYMKIPLILNAVVVCVGLPIALWWFFIRPWLRERRITLDGMLLVSMGLMFFQDPLPQLLQHVVHLQQLAAELGRVDAAHSRLGFARRTRPDGAGTAVDELTGIRRRCPDADHPRLLADAQDQVALAEHQQSAADPASPTRRPSSSTSSWRA